MSISTANATFQKALRRVWDSGSTYAEITTFFGITRDQAIRLRDVLLLPLRHDRAMRKKGPRHRDPTPAEIAAACAALRAKHLEDRRNESDRQYREGDEYVRFRLQRQVPLGEWPELWRDDSDG